MTFIENLYRSATVDEKAASKWKKRLSKGRGVIGLQLVILRPADRNLMEIVASLELKRLCGRENDIWVIGMAQGRQEAFQLVGSICLEMIEKYGKLTKDDLMKELTGCGF